MKEVITVLQKELEKIHSQEKHNDKMNREGKWMNPETTYYTIKYRFKEDLEKAIEVLGKVVL